MEILIYLLKTGALLALFFLIYELLLKRETFFTLNRLFLFSGIIIALSLPFVSFTKTQVIEKTIATTPILESEFLSDFSFEHGSVVENQTLLSHIEWTHRLLFIYGIGVLFFSIRFLISLISLRKILKSSSHSFHENGFRFIETAKETNPFTFFKTIVYNPKQYKNDELKMILHHEKTHAKQWHSVDILISQVLIVFQWMNPIAWLYAKRMDQNLEFIADQKTTSENFSKKTYQIKLLQSAYYGELSLPVNNFHSFTKNRIMMMNKNKSHRMKSLKALLILPLIAAFLMSFQVKTNTVYNTVQQENPQKELVSFSDLDELNKIFKDYNPDTEILFNGKKVTIKSIVSGLYKLEEVKFNNDNLPVIRAPFQKDADMALLLEELDKGIYLYFPDESGVIVVLKDVEGRSDQVVVFKPAKNVREESEKTVASMKSVDTTKEGIVQDEKGNITIIGNDGSVIYKRDLEGTKAIFIQKDGKVIDIDEEIEKAFLEKDQVLKDLWEDRDEINSRFEDLMTEQNAIREQRLKAREEIRKNRMEVHNNRAELNGSRDSLRNERMKMRGDIQKQRDSLMAERELRRKELQERRANLASKEGIENLQEVQDNDLKYSIGKKDNKVIALFFEIDKNTTDSQLNQITQKFLESDIDFIIQKIKRNTSGEITDLKMTLNNRKDANAQVSQQGTDGIKAYTIGMKEGKIFMTPKN